MSYTSETYIGLTGSVTNNRLELARFANKSLLSQNLIRKIQSPVSSPISSFYSNRKNWYFN